MKKIVVLSGAGVSAESGIKTFRDSDGLWEGHDVMEVATPTGWSKNPELVLDFYNQRRKQLLEVKPNKAHEAICHLEQKYIVNVITQNVDNLHERAGSTRVMHLHGLLTSVRSVSNPSIKYHWESDLKLGDLADDGSQLRPDIVWFGEAVPLIEPASVLCAEADVLVIVGTSLQVYPAAGLMAYAKSDVPIYYIDPFPKSNYELESRKHLQIIAKKASEGVSELVERLLK